MPGGNKEKKKYDTTEEFLNSILPFGIKIWAGIKIYLRIFYAIKLYFIISTFPNFTKFKKAVPSTFTQMSWFEFFISIIEIVAFQQISIFGYASNIHAHNSILLSTIASFNKISYLIAIAFQFRYIREAIELIVKYFIQQPNNNQFYSSLKKFSDSQTIIKAIKYIECYALLELLLYKIVMKANAKRTLILLYYFLYQIKLSAFDDEYKNIWSQFDQSCLRLINKLPWSEKICIVYTILSQKLKVIIRFISNVREL